MVGFCIAAPWVVTSGSVLRPGHVRVVDDRIVSIGGGVPDRVDVVLPDGMLAPGLVDLQVNGAFGVNLAGAPPEDWFGVARRLTATGVTAFTPTFITAPVPALTAAMERYAALRPALDATPGAARTLGVHLEGPFLSVGRRGAHPREDLCDPTPGRVDRLLAAGGGVLACVTLAPERAGGLDAVRRLRSAGVRVSVGHSDATDDVVHAAADAGATGVTHLYNAMRPLGHRDLGVVGAAFTDPRLTLGLIVDLCHVLPGAVRIAFTAAPGRVALVTDAVAALGMPAGRYTLGGEVIDYEPGGPPSRPDGTIAGSALRMDEAVANTVRCGVGLVAALDAATRVPADTAGRPDLGRLEPGAMADLVWLSERLVTRATWVAGRLAFVAEGVHGLSAG